MKRVVAVLVVALSCVFWARAEAQTPVPHGKPSRPLIFIPGIAGSELWLNNRRAWGSADAMLHFEDLRIADGPKETVAAPTCDPGNRDARYLASCGPINALAILGPLKYDVYEPLFQYLETLGYTRFGPDKNLFIFSYDWRRSNFESAADLKNFINSTPILAGKDLDVLAHSMGGLISLIYAHRYDAPSGANGACEPSQTCRLKTVITMGTPYWGSASAVATPVLGWGWLSRKIAGGSETIARTVLSWPSLYELLPTYEGCCALAQSGTSRPLDLMKQEDFALLPFGIPQTSPARVSDALKKAVDLRRLASTGFPNHVRNANACPRISEGLYLIAGDQNGTRQSVAIRASNFDFIERRGDGTVLLRSASLGNPAAAFLSFTPHMSIFNEKNVRAKLETILFRCEMGFRDFNNESVSVRMDRPFAVAEVLPVDYVTAEIVEINGNDHFAVRGALSVAAPDDAIAPKALVKIRFNGAEFFRTEVAPKSKRLDGRLLHFDYERDGLTVPGEGRIDLEVTFGEGGPTAIDQSYAFGR